MLGHYGLLMAILAAGVVYSLAARKLTPAAALTGVAVACLVFAGGGYTGLAMMTIFFILGSAATSLGKQTKQQFEDAKEKKGRTAGQVIANAGTGAIAGLLVIFFPGYSQLWILMMAAGFASATADTLSSELGTVYGRRFVNIITLKPDQRGLDGVISLEGIVIGLAGSIIISLVYAIGFGWHQYLIAAIIMAGTIGNLTDSILGATLERRKYISNNLVNFFNTLGAALIMLLLYFI